MEVALVFGACTVSFIVRFRRSVVCVLLVPGSFPRVFCGVIVYW